jgi:hypothetical protein
MRRNNLPLVPLRTIWPWPESDTHSSTVYQPLSNLSRTGKLNAYRADTGTSASDEDGLAKQSGCVEDGHR